MDFLIPIFEEQLDFLRDEKGHVLVDTHGNISIGETPLSPVAILKLDESAYKQEYANWFENQWLSQQKDMLDSILPTHANAKRFADLCASLKNGQLIPLIGSGMSVPSGLSVWPLFLRTIRQHSSMSEGELNDLLARWDYEEAVERLAAAMPGRLFDERIEHDLRIDDSNMVAGAIRFLPELFDRLVLTTNLDDLLERLFELRKKKFSHVLSGQAISEYRRARGASERILLKLHGDCRSRNGRVLGKREYEEAYRVGSAIREELTTIYRTHSLLCLGCSLGPDRTVGLLAEVAELDPGIPKHYAFLQYPKSEDELLEREHFLTARDIFPIWYPDDHDESIQALLVGMIQYLGRL